MSLFIPQLRYDLPKFRRAMAKHANKAGVVKIAVYGESHVAGEGAGSSTAGSVGAFPFSFSQVVGKLLGQYYGPISTDAFIGDQNILATTVTYPNYDTRVAFGTGWASDSAPVTLGGRFIIGAVSSAGTLDFTPQNAYDTVVVVYTQASNASNTLNVANGSGSLGNINTNGATAYLTQSFTATLGSSKISLKNNDASHQAYVNGIYTYNSASPGAILFPMGWCGGTSTQLVDTSTAYSPLAALKTFAPDLTILEEYGNDVDGSVAPATYQANMDAIIAGAQISGDVISVFNFPINNANYTSGIAAYVTAQQALGNKYGVNIIDLTNWFGSTWSAANTLGLAYDSNHPNQQGHGLYGQMVASALRGVL